MPLGKFPRAILLDLDGTLAASLSVLRATYNRFLESLQRHPSESEFDSLNGPTLPNIVRRLRQTHALEQSEEILLDRYKAYVEEAYLDVRPTAGAPALLRAARDNRCIVGVVTSNTSAIAQSWLDTNNLSYAVDFLVASEDVVKGKPDPEPYLIAARLTACPLADISVVEDSLSGVCSSLAAGLETFVLTHSSGEVWPQGVRLVGSFSDLTERFWRA